MREEKLPDFPPATFIENLDDALHIGEDLLNDTEKGQCLMAAHVLDMNKGYGYARNKCSLTGTLWGPSERINPILIAKSLMRLMYKKVPSADAAATPVFEPRFTDPEALLKTVVAIPFVDNGSAEITVLQEVFTSMVGRAMIVNSGKHTTTAKVASATQDTVHRAFDEQELIKIMGPVQYDDSVVLSIGDD